VEGFESIESQDEARSEKKPASHRHRSALRLAFVVIHWSKRVVKNCRAVRLKGGKRREGGQLRLKPHVSSPTRAKSTSSEGCTYLFFQPCAIPSWSKEDSTALRKASRRASRSIDGRRTFRARRASRYIDDRLREISEQYERDL